MGQSRDALRRGAVELALEAGRAIMAVYSQLGFAVEQKSDASPVTAADKAADALLQRALAALSGDPVISEESPLPPYETRRGWPRFWLVDPLDGTRDFVAKTGDFAVCIALIEGDRPVIGVVSAPAHGVTWSAAEGVGAFARIGDQEQPLAPRASGPRIALVSRFHKGERDDQPPAAYGIESQVVMGSALKFGRMAEGAADLYLRHTPTNEWDVAAGDCLVNAAGCKMTGPDGTLLRYNGENLKVPGFIVTSPRLDGRGPAGHRSSQS